MPKTKADRENGPLIIYRVLVPALQSGTPNSLTPIAGQAVSYCQRRLAALSHFFQFCDDVFKILGQFRKDHHRPAVSGMLEAEGACVEALTVLAQLRLFPAVDDVAQDRMTDVGHVDTDLMGAAGFQPAAPARG